MEIKNHTSFLTFMTGLCASNIIAEFRLMIARTHPNAMTISVSLGKTNHGWILFTEYLALFFLETASPTLVNDNEKKSRACVPGASLRICSILKFFVVIFKLRGELGITVARGVIFATVYVSGSWLLIVGSNGLPMLLVVGDVLMHLSSLHRWFLSGWLLIASAEPLQLGRLDDFSEWYANEEPNWHALATYCHDLFISVLGQPAVCLSLYLKNHCAPTTCKFSLGQGRPTPSQPQRHTSWRQLRIANTRSCTKSDLNMFMHFLFSLFSISFSQCTLPPDVQCPCPYKQSIHWALFPLENIYKTINNIGTNLCLESKVGWWACPGAVVVVELLLILLHQLALSIKINCVLHIIHFLECLLTCCIPGILCLALLLF